MQWTRKLQLPIASVILAIALIAMTLALPRFDVGAQSTIARIVKEPAPGVQTRVTAPPMPIPYVAKKSQTGWEISDPQTQSWDFATQVMDGKVPDAFVFTYSPPTKVESGFYALTRRETFESLVIWPDHQDQDTAARRVIALQYLVSHGQPADIAIRLKSGNVFESKLLRDGFIYDGVALILLILFIWSLAWIFLVPTWIRSRRQHGRIARGECATCAYSSKDLNGAPCPECGALPNQPAANRPEKSTN